VVEEREALEEEEEEEEEREKTAALLLLLSTEKSQRPSLSPHRSTRTTRTLSLLGCPPGNGSTSGG